MSLAEIVAWTAVTSFLVLRIGMLAVFVAMPVIIVRGLHHQSEA
jgi:hypothetical protein